MIKVQFWLKNPSSEQGNLENITIDNPKKISEGKLVGMYSCEIYLSDKKKSFPISALNPVDALLNASEFVKIYLQGLINRGYSISEVASKEPWKLEKVDISSIVRERINKLETMFNEDKSISPKIKQECLESLRKLVELK